MDVSIITSLYNRLDLTRVYLEDLRRTLGNWRYEVILIDDGSTDGTREFLATLPPERFRVLLNETPRGFAANNNAGARLARAPLLCLLNNDTSLLPGWLDPMARLANADRRAAMVGNIQREPVSGLIDHFGVYFSADDGQPLHAGKNCAYAPLTDYLAWPAVTAACCVIRKKVFEALGGFDERFQNGFEDIDFCLRATAAGFHHFVANRSVIYHHVSASPNRRRHEDANVALFRSTWRGRVPLGLPPAVAIDPLHREGNRYLRKHLARPWRYNLWRLCRALEQRLQPWPASSRPGLFVRWQIKLAEVGTKPPMAEEANVQPDAGTVYVVVHDTVRNPGRSGIQTVVRSLAAALGRAGANVRAVIWDSDANCLRLLPPTLSIGLVAERLRDPAAPTVPWHELPHTRGHWVLMPELMYDGAGARLVEYCHQSGAKLAVVFYDAIPVSHPQFVPSTLSERHTAYLRDFSRADKILPISEASAEAWREFVAAHGLPRPAVRTCLLASDLSATSRVRSTDISYPKMDRSLPVRILCVSTIEARKNHRALLAAYEIAAARTDLTLELRLVGAPYVGAQDLSGEVERFVARHSGRVTWHEQIEYSLLNRLYEECDFTVYPSLLEGFGLPIIESLWFGRPCVCANFGVMAENAAGGGCVMVDVRNIQALADAILALAESPQRRYELALQATTRELKTWDEYAVEVLACLN